MDGHTPAAATASHSSAEMAALLERQRAAFLRDGTPDAATRQDRLSRAIDILVQNADAFADALEADFGTRSRNQSLLSDIAASIGPLKHARKHVARWMKPQKRAVDFEMRLLGGKAEIRPQPKGVAGLIAPWNFPVNMVFAPLAGMLAAGNRVMIKPSEFTPATAALMKELFAAAFHQDEIAVVTGGADTGAAFSALPFDHLMFTGSTGVGRHIMRAASENLVPVTLELGGKSPTILGESANLDVAAKRILFGKTMNAGQICLSPDHAFVPRGKVDGFVAAMKAAHAGFYPEGVLASADYTAIITDRHATRLQGLLEDAAAKGARLVPLEDGAAPTNARLIVPTLVLDVTPDMTIMQEEIFGPLLPVLPYDRIEDVVAQVNAGPRPLALYYFGTDKAERDRVVNSTTSGGVTVNDVIQHIAQEDLPFGGIGPSGMGAYHGHEGFLEFSHMKPVYLQTRSEMLKMIRPPYGETFAKFLGRRIKG